MKRPEGFDPAGQKPRSPAAPPRASKPAQKPLPPKQQPQKAELAPKPQAKPQPRTVPLRQPVPRPSRQPRPDAAARADLRAAAKERRRFERAEVRRFTRRARSRRLAVAVLAGTVATLVGLVFLAIYSPILALRVVTVDGTSRVDATEVVAAADGQLGTPLALLDYDAITRELSAFPLIRSYVTEIVPPDTLVIHVTERQPVGTVQANGVFELVDPAGITVQQSAERIPGVPIIDLGTGDRDGPGFRSMVEVLLALPPELLATVDRVSASTQDDVTLTLAGVDQSVIWGSADDSAKKARLLAALIGLTPAGSAGVFDVSAPGNGVFRPS